MYRSSGLTTATAATTCYTKAQSDAAGAVVAATASANTDAITNTTAASVPKQSGISILNGKLAGIMSGSHSLEALNVFDGSYSAQVTPTNVAEFNCKSDVINTAALLIKPTTFMVTLRLCF